MNKINDNKHVLEFWIDPETMSVARPGETRRWTGILFREVDSIDERWREKYYDKCEELNKAEARIKELEKIIEDIEYGPRD